jgi:hypothetical protein
MPRMMESEQSIMKSTSDQTIQALEVSKTRRAGVPSTYVRKRLRFKFRIYCNWGSNSATCPCGWVIS